jgi:methyl-accepting chemotaxis protein
VSEIVASIAKVYDIVSEISAASVEQSSGVRQVAQAVTEMDQVTQQNAALVEESAAAADSLESQSRQLLNAVAVFRLNQRPLRATAPTATAPATPAPASKPSPVRVQAQRVAIAVTAPARPATSVKSRPAVEPMPKPM